MLRIIVVSTNKYARANGSGQGRLWTDLTRDELKRWLGIVICIGVFPAPVLREYSTDESVRPDKKLRSTKAQLCIDQINISLSLTTTAKEERTISSRS